MVAPRVVRRVGVCLGAVLGGLTVAIVGWQLASGIRQANEYTHPRRVRVGDEERRRAFADIPGLEEVRFSTSDGLSLRGWFAPGRRRAAVVFVHGLWGNRASLEPEAALIARHGYGVLLFDSRAEGDSDGDLATWGDREQRDVAAAVDYVSGRPEVDPRKIGLLGFSVGGSTAAMAAARDPRVRAVILYATWTSLDEEMRAKHSRWGPFSYMPVILRMRYAGVDFANVRPIDVIGAIAPRPLLMVAGGQDEDTPLPIMEEVFSRAGEPKRMWVVPEAHHGGVFQARPAEYESVVLPFLDGSVGGSAGEVDAKTP